MFDYTRTAIDKIIYDLKKICFNFTLGMQILYIIYLLYAIFMRSGVFIINIILLILSLAYLTFYIYKFHSKSKKVNRAFKQTKQAFKWLKLLMKAFTLAVAIYGMYTTFNQEYLNPISVILTALMVISWTIQVIIEVILYWFKKEKEFVFTAIKSDASELIKPIHAVKDFFDKAKGKEKDTTDTYQKSDKKIQKLDKLVEERRKTEKQEKERKKSIRKEKFIGIFKSKAYGQKTSTEEKKNSTDVKEPSIKS